VWVNIYKEETEVFRGKFILVATKQKEKIIEHIN
jgi:hypothetical protein